MSTPVITIFVRHSSKDEKPCKYADDEFSRRCNCWKHFRWTQNGTQYRRKAGTRTWAEAEEIKRQLQDQLAGRTPEVRQEYNVPSVSEAVDLFITDKTGEIDPLPCCKNLRPTVVWARRRSAPVHQSGLRHHLRIRLGH